MIAAGKGPLDRLDRTNRFQPRQRIKIIQQVVLVLGRGVEHCPLRGLGLALVKETKVEQERLPVIGQA